MNALGLLEKLYTNPEAFAIVLEHSRLVAAKALQVVHSLKCPGLDIHFIEEAALLHDIGVCRTDAPGLHCFGVAPYIQHGILGREILEAEGLPRHALVCERHIGVGLTMEDIQTQKLPLPLRDMRPVTMEERIVCFADLFYSKKPRPMRHEKTITDIREGLEIFGGHKVRIFEEWLGEFLPFSH